MVGIFFWPNFEIGIKINNGFLDLRHLEIGLSPALQGRCLYLLCRLERQHFGKTIHRLGVITRARGKLGLVKQLFQFLIIRRQ